MSRWLAFALTCSFAAFAYAASTTAAPEREMRAIFLVNPGPANPKGASLLNNPGIGEHARHMIKLHAMGKMVRGGPFADGTGGLGIAAKGVTTDELTRLLADDPAVKSGLIVYEVRTWMIGVGEP